MATLGTTNLDVISAGRVPDRRSRRCEPCGSSDRTGGAARVTPRLACPLRWPLRARRTIRSGPRAGNGLIHELGGRCHQFIHESATYVDGMWTTSSAGCARDRRESNGPAILPADIARPAAPGPAARSSAPSRKPTARLPTNSSFGRPTPEPTGDARLKAPFGRPLPETCPGIRRRELPPSVRSPTPELTPGSRPTGGPTGGGPGGSGRSTLLGRGLVRLVDRATWTGAVSSGESNGPADRGRAEKRARALQAPRQSL